MLLLVLNTKGEETLDILKTEKKSQIHIKKVEPCSEKRIRIRRRRLFLQAIVSTANSNRRKYLIKYANKDQVNAVSEIVLNLPKKTTWQRVR